MKALSRRLFAYALLAGFAVTLGFARPASAALILMESGLPGNVGDPDPDTDVSIDGGGSFIPAVISTPHPLYSTLPGSQWIVAPGAGTNSDSIFRTFFTLPSGFLNPVLSTSVHADNVATVLLNGTSLGSQTFAEIVPNFQNPAEVFGTSNGALFVSGQNELRYLVHNFSGPTALDYLASVNFDVRQANGPIVPEPASMIMMGMGLAAFGARRRSRA